MTATAKEKTPRLHISPLTQVRTPRILCVDDDPDIQTSLELRLRAYDIEIEHAFYGMQGIAQSHNTVYDLIIMDVAMPNGDGKYLLECVRENPATQNVPVVVLTGMRNPELRANLLARGADAYFTKPVLFEDLLAEMRRHIAVRKLEEGV